MEMEVENDFVEEAIDNSDSDSSDSDDEAEKAELKRADELERQIADNKYLYNAHEELVKLYQKLGDLKSMRLAYQRFHEHFPLTAELWLVWINTEKGLASNETEIQHVFTLFDKAVEDYLSVKLWVEYAQYSIGAANATKSREILERGLQSAGLHAAEGSLLWDTLRELELAHFQLDPTNSEQLTKVTEAFRRQLCVPLLNMESTYAEWTQFVAEIPPEHKINATPLEWGYKKALNQLETYKKHEMRLLAAAEADLLPAYRDYIRDVSDPSTVICLYERAAAQLCLSPEIWLDYCGYAAKLGDFGEKTLQKALRNCPWSDALWVERLRMLERLARAPSEALACFELGVASVDPALAVNLWLAYLEHLHRTETGDKGKLHKVFEQALRLFQCGSAEHTLIARFYAHILAESDRLLEARKIWKVVLKNPDNRKLSALWLAYARFERLFGDCQRARSVFERALASETDWPAGVADEWRMLEREAGALDDVVRCEAKIAEVVRVLPMVEAKPQKRRFATKETEVVEKRQKIDAKRPKDDENKPKFDKKPAIAKEKDPETTVFISNLHPSVTEKRLQKVFPNAVGVEVALDKLGKSRCYGYVQFKMAEEAAHALARDREPLDNRPMFVSACRPDRGERRAQFKYSNDVEENKLFVRGLPVGRDEAEVEALFKPFGAIGVRLVRHKSGQSKGLAYVEFPEAEMAKKALEGTNGMDVGGFKISVAISAPPKKDGVAKGALGGGVVGAGGGERRGKRLQAAMVPRALMQGKVKNGGDEEGREKPKSNDEFRKMLLK